MTGLEDIDQEHFALAELALMNGLSDNITLGLNRITGLAMQTNTGGTIAFISYDEHNAGAYTTLLANTISNLCMGGCLLELIDRLKSANLFTETMIDYSGEMDRNPRSTEGGSDHGGAGNEFYPGSWGYGAPNVGIGTINQGHLAATQAQILRVENPVRSVGSLVTETGGVFRSFLPTGKIR